MAENILELTPRKKKKWSACLEKKKMYGYPTESNNVLEKLKDVVCLSENVILWAANQPIIFKPRASPELYTEATNQICSFRMEAIQPANNPCGKYLGLLVDYSVSQ